MSLKEENNQILFLSRENAYKK